MLTSRHASEPILVLVKGWDQAIDEVVATQRGISHLPLRRTG
jgi:hypothetical protein